MASEVELLRELEGVRSDIGALIVEQVENNQVIQGNVYTCRRVIDVPAAGLDAILDPTPASGKFVVLLPLFFEAVGGNEIDIDLYVGSEYSAGTTQPSVNRNQQSTNTADSIIKTGVTIDTLGVATGLQWFLPSQSQGNVTVAGQSTGNLIFNIDTSLVQHLRITNQDTSSQRLFFNITWFEIG